MNTSIVYEKEGKKYNRWHQEVIPCSADCGRCTVMLGTKLCDPCWERQRHRTDETTS